MVPALLPLLVLLAAILYALHLAGLLTALIDPLSIALVLGGTLILLLGSFSVREIAAAVRFLFSRETEIPRRKAALLAELYAAAGDYALFTGLIGAYIGTVLILQTVDDPAYLGPQFAVSSITYIYGFGLYALMSLAGRRLSLCLLTEGDYPIPTRRQVVVMLVAALAFLALLALVIEWSGSLISFWDPASLVLLLGGSLAGMLLFVPWDDLTDCCRLRLGRDVISEERVVRVLGSFDQYNHIVIVLIFIGAGAGLIGVLSCFGGNPDFGPHLAFALLAVLYGTVIICFSRAKQSVVQRGLAAVGLRAVSAPKFGAAWLAGSSLVLYLLTIATLVFLFLPVES